MWTGSTSSWARGLSRLLLGCALCGGGAGVAVAADAWHGDTLTGTGRTEALTACHVHSTTTASCIARRATALASVLTIYTADGAGGLTASAYTPDTPSVAAVGKVLAWGGDATHVFVGGGSTVNQWLQQSTIPPTSWTMERDAAAGGDTGDVTPTGVGKTYQLAELGDYTFNFSVPFSLGNYATSSGVSPAADSEQVSTTINANYYCSIAGEYSSGTPGMRGYTSGTSFAFETVSSAIMNTGTYFYPPFKLNALLCVSTHKKQSNSHTYIMSAPIAGAITTIDAGAIDLAPVCQWDPSGAEARGWWVNKADGSMYKSNSVSDPTSVANDATYDLGSGPLGGSTPIAAICGLDMDGDGAAWTGDNADNPVILMADGAHFAWWGEVVSGSSVRPPPRRRTGPFNSFPFAMPGGR